MPDFTMIVSGEGPTDLGDEWAGELKPGPMLEMVLKILTGTAVGNCAPANVRLVKESGLRHEAEALRKQNRRFFLQPRGPEDKEMGFFRRNAQTLGHMAVKGQFSAAIFFRDADRTRSAPAGEWQKKVDSIENGFALADCRCGVAMVPRPVSEAWLLAVVAPKGMDGYEDLPGNDASPAHPKKKLESEHGIAGGEQLVKLVRDSFSPGSITMPSYKRFEDRLVQVATQWSTERDE